MNQDKGKGSPFWLVVAAALGSGAIWFYLNHQSAPSPEIPPPAEIPSFKPSIPVHSKPATPPPTRPHLPPIHEFKAQPGSGPATKPTGNIIEFRIVDGFAVAYGDILLGKPDGPIPGDRGTYEAPIPQAWDRPEIAYSISPELPNPERIEKALSYLKQKTPLTFIPYSGQKDAILFEPGTEHCLSLLGKVGGIQPIKLSPQCRWQEVIHEILHSLGFVHEQSRGDRDQYVDILWDNIEERYRDQFAIAPDSFLELIRHFPFDYHSVMLYQPDAFALKPELFSMRSKGAEAIEPTQEGLSEGDIRRLNRIYRGYE